MLAFPKKRHHGRIGNLKALFAPPSRACHHGSPLAPPRGTAAPPERPGPSASLQEFLCMSLGAQASRLLRKRPRWPRSQESVLS
jgi:hypothetical protein